MELNPVPTELTTAATDAVLAVLALLCAGWLFKRRENDPWKVNVWVMLLGLLAMASALGAAVHGFTMPERASSWLWQPLYLSLGLVVALFVVAAVYDGIGARAARLTFAPALVVGGGFYLVTVLFPGTFMVFVLYEAAAMVAALALYGRLALGRRRGWMWLMVAGIAFNIVAAGIQATKTVRLEIGVPFDHNGVFHLVQMVAVVVLFAGVVRGLNGVPEGTYEAEEKE